VSPLTEFAARVVLLPMFIVATALIVKGYGHTGDGFSAGVMAAAGVLLQYVVFGAAGAARRMRLVRVGPAAAVAGLLVMLAVVFAGPLAGAPLLTHWPPPGDGVAHVAGIEVHTALLFDLGVALVVFGALVSMMEMLSEAAGSGE
jgi:multisubunit Na+/H+ antiporter MnhB subunit